MRGFLRSVVLSAVISVSFVSNAQLDGESYIDSVSSTSVKDRGFKKRFWKTGYFNWATQSLKDTHEGTAQLTTYNYISFGFNPSYGSNFSIRPTFILNTAGKSALTGQMQEQDFKLGDIYLQYTKYNMALLPGDIGLLGKVRLYIPASESSKRQTKVTQLRGWFIFSKPIGRGLEINYHVKPRISFFKQRGTLNSRGTRVYGNRPYELWNQLELVQNVTSKWGFSQSIGYKSQWSWDVPSSSVAAEQNDYALADIGAFVKLGSVFLRAQLLNEILLPHSDSFFTKDRAVKYFRPDETKYSLMTYIRF